MRSLTLTKVLNGLIYGGTALSVLLAIISNWVSMPNWVWIAPGAVSIGIVVACVLYFFYIANRKL